MAYIEQNWCFLFNFYHLLISKLLMNFLLIMLEWKQSKDYHISFFHEQKSFMEDLILLICILLKESQ